jgi:hypothetical protein
MRLTRRGKRLRALLIFTLLAGAVAFRATHHPVYSCPDNWVIDRVCTLTHYAHN